MEWYSLQQTAEHYHVTKSTVSDWRKTDKITYSGGGRVFVYQWDYPKFDKPAEPEKKSQSEADKIREQIEIEKLKQELNEIRKQTNLEPIPEDRRIEDKVTLVTIEEERQVIIDDANKEAERIIAEAVNKAVNQAKQQADAILEEAQEALDHAEELKEDISKRERALHNRETELDEFEDYLGEKEEKLTKRVREEDLLLLDNKERWQANKQSEINRAITEHCLTCIQGKYVYNPKHVKNKFVIKV